MIMHVPRDRTSSRRSGVGTILWAWTTSLTPQPPHWNKRARCPSPRRPLRGGRGPRNPGPGVVRTGRPLNAPRPLGYGGGRRWLVGAGQPAGRFPSRGAQARAPLLATLGLNLGPNLLPAPWPGFSGYAPPEKPVPALRSPRPPCSGWSRCRSRWPLPSEPWR